MRDWTKELTDAGVLELSEYTDRLEAREIIDTAGEPGLEVLVVLRPGLEVTELKWDQVSAVSRRILDLVPEWAPGRFPYIRFATPEELAELAAEAEEDARITAEETANGGD